jgi:hypothetical protein
MAVLGLFYLSGKKECKSIVLLVFLSVNYYIMKLGDLYQPLKKGEELWIQH